MKRNPSIEINESVTNENVVFFHLIIHSFLNYHSIKPVFNYTANCVGVFYSISCIKFMYVHLLLFFFKLYTKQ